MSMNYRNFAIAALALGSQSGLGDIVQSVFFSPVEPTGGGWIVGAGPVFLLPTAWTFTANVESTYDWEGEQWSIPLNLVATKVTRVGGQLVSFGTGLRYWVDAPDAGPEGLGLRFALTLLFPR